jgi:hypothetical protein
MKHDRFLLVIVLAIAGLVVLALALFFLRRNPQEYILEDTPQGVVHNYVLALQKGEYSRAYDYLAQKTDKPDFERYQTDLLMSKRELDRLSVQLGSVEETGNNAFVRLTIIHPGGGPLADVWREDASALLVRMDGAWKIIGLPYPFYQPVVYPSKSPGL